MGLISYKGFVDLVEKAAESRIRRPYLTRAYTCSTH